MSTDRQTIAVYEEDRSTSDFEGTLATIKATIDSLIDMYGLEAYLDYGQHTHYSDRYSYALYTSRLETDDEVNSRKKLDALREQKVEAHERSLLEKLIKKYGDPENTND